MNEMDQINEIPTTTLQDEEVLKLDPAAAPPEKKKSKKWLIGAAAAAVLVIAAVIVIFSLLQSPLGRLFTAGKNTAKAMQSSELGKITENVSKNGRVSLQADFSKMGSLIGSAIGFPLSLDASADITLFHKEDANALSMDLSLGGKSLINGLLVLTDKELAISSEALLGKTNYGVNLKNLSRNLENSVFDPAKNGKYAMSAELYDTLKKWNFGEPSTSQMKKDAESLWDEAKDQLKASLSKNAKISQGSGALTIAGKDINCTTVLIEGDGKTVRLILEDMLNWAKNSKKMTQLIDKLSQKLNPLLASASLDLNTQYSDYLKKFEESLPELEKQLEGVSITQTSYIHKNNLIGLSLDAVKASERFSLTAKFGPDPKTPEQILLQAAVPGGNVYNISYLVTANNAEQYLSNLNINIDGNEIPGAEFSWDKKAGNLRISLGGNENRIVLKANLSKEKGVTTLALNSLEGIGENTTPLDGFKLIIDENPTFPSTPHYTEITSMSEAQIDSVLEGIGAYFQGILGNLGGLFGNLLPFGN